LTRFFPQRERAILPRARIARRRQISTKSAVIGNVGREEVMSREIDEKAQKIHNPQAEFDKPSDVVKDSELSLNEKKKALKNLEQDAHQLMTASNEGMAPENDRVVEHEPELDEVWSRLSSGLAKSRNTTRHNRARAAGLASASQQALNWRASARGALVGCTGQPGSG